MFLSKGSVDYRNVERRGWFRSGHPDPAKAQDAAQVEAAGDPAASNSRGAVAAAALEVDDALIASDP